MQNIPISVKVSTISNIDCETELLKRIAKPLHYWFTLNVTNWSTKRAPKSKMCIGQIVCCVGLIMLARNVSSCMWRGRVWTFNRQTTVATGSETTWRRAQRLYRVWLLTSPDTICHVRSVNGACVKSCYIAFAFWIPGRPTTMGVQHNGRSHFQ